MLLRRQDPSSSSSSSSTDTGPPNPTLHPLPSNVPHTMLEPWKIALIVVGSIAFLGTLGTLFILLRTRLAIRRGASTTRFDHAHADEFPIESEPPTTKRERRHSVVDDAKTHIRRLLQKKSRPRSSSYPSTPASPYKSGGLDFGLGTLRFGGEKDVEKGKRNKRRKSQSGLDVRLRSADGHPTDEVYAGRAPSIRDDDMTASGSGFRIGGSGISSATPRREEIGRAAPRPRESEEQYWSYGDHSIAHTVRGSFEDGEEEERQRSLMHQLQQQQLGAAMERLAEGNLRALS